MIDLSQLPTPAIVETLNVETLYSTLKNQLLVLMPEDQRDSLAAVLALESDPVVKLLQLCAYREMLLRQRINEAAKATLLAYATGSDLDNKAADYGVSRLLISAADPDTGATAVYESDERLRLRTQMAMDGMSVAGPRAAYVFHAMSASALVADVSVENRGGGELVVYIQSTDGNATADLLDTVNTALNDETVRPLCDTVTVQAGTPQPYAITARIEWVAGGESAAGRLSALQTSLASKITAWQKLENTIPLSAIIGTLQKDGVFRVSLASPVTDVVCTAGQYPLCTGINLS